MDDSGINTLCDLFGQTFSRNQFKYQFRCRTCLRENIILICKTLIADMMIDTCCFLCMLKIFCRIPKSSKISAVLCDKQVITFFRSAVAYDLIRIFHEFENVWDRLQIQTDIYVWIICCNIVIGCKAGADTVSIRSDMTCNGNCLYSCEKFIKTFHVLLHPQIYAFRMSYSSVSSSLLISFVTSSIILDIFTPYSID